MYYYLHGDAHEVGDGGGVVNHANGADISICVVGTICCEAWCCVCTFVSVCLYMCVLSCWVWCVWWWWWGGRERENKCACDTTYYSIPGGVGQGSVGLVQVRVSVHY